MLVEHYLPVLSLRFVDCLSLGGPRQPCGRAPPTSRYARGFARVDRHSAAQGLPRALRAFCARWLLLGLLWGDTFDHVEFGFNALHCRCVEFLNRHVVYLKRVGFVFVLRLLRWPVGQVCVESPWGSDCLHLRCARLCRQQQSRRRVRRA